MIDYSKIVLDKLIEGLPWFDMPSALKEIFRRLKTTTETLDTRVEALENAPAPVGGVETITGDFVDDTDPSNIVISRGYKVYVAIVNQAGTDAPVLTVLENDLGVTITPTRTSVGDYTFTPSSAILNLTKTTIDISPVKFTSVPSTSKATYTIEHVVNSVFKVYTHQAGSSTWSQTDNNFRNNKLEIRVYP